MNLATFEVEALGSKWWFQIHQKITKAKLDIIQSKTISELLDFEEKYSRFKENSLISKLNQHKKLQNFPAELFQMLSLAKQVEIVSGGSFNVFVGSILEQLGYDKDYSFKSKKDSSADLSKSGFAIFSKDYLEISKSSSLDLGGIGKGWMIDKLVKIYKKDFGLNYFTINGGGDIFSTGLKNKSLPFELENPLDISTSMGQVFLQNQAIACSSFNKRRWTNQFGEELHHLISPKNNNDKSLLAVFTFAKNALQADLASTSLFVSNSENFLKICDFLEASFLLVFKNGQTFAHPNYPGKLYS